LYILYSNIWCTVKRIRLLAVIIEVRQKYVFVDTSVARRTIARNDSRLTKKATIEWWTLFISMRQWRKTTACIKRLIALRWT